MSWRMDSTAGAAVWDTQPLSTSDLACRDEELAWLKKHGRRDWRIINGRIAEQGDPTALQGMYAGLIAPPPVQNVGPVTGVTALTALYAASTYAPIPANTVTAPEGFRIAMSGAWTSGATASPTVVWTPAVSTTVVTPGLGASAAMVYVINITTGFWMFEGEFTIRTAGSGGTAYGMFKLLYTTAAGPSPATSTATNPSTALFGNTVQTVDCTAAQGFTTGITPSNTTISHTVSQIQFSSGN